MPLIVSEKKRLAQHGKAKATAKAAPVGMGNGLGRDKEQGEVTAEPGELLEVLTAGQLVEWKEKLADEARGLLRDDQYKRLIPYLQFYHSTSDAEFQRIIKSVLPFGQPMCPYHRNSALRVFEPRGARCRYLGMGQSPSMAKVMYYEKGRIAVNEVRQRSITTADLWGLRSQVPHRRSRHAARP